MSANPISTQPFSREEFASSKCRGLLLVTFASKEDDVPKRVQMAEETVEQAEAFRLGDQPYFSRIDILVVDDPRFADTDCGKTKDALIEKLKPHRSTFIASPKGDAFSEIKNAGFAIQSRHGIDYTMTLSPEARSYLNQETLDAVSDAACSGALVVGVAIGELEESILEGRVAGTFALWHTMAILSVGGMDMHAAGRRKNDQLVRYLKGYGPDGAELFYPLAGVEEVVPCARLADGHGPCIAPILPRGADVKRYEVPDREKQPELYARHNKKMGTKKERQTAHLNREGYDLSYLKNYGVMPQYRQKT